MTFTWSSVVKIVSWLVGSLEVHDAVKLLSLRWDCRITLVKPTILQRAFTVFCKNSLFVSLFHSLSSLWRRSYLCHHPFWRSSHMCAAACDLLTFSFLSHGHYFLFLWHYESWPLRIFHWLLELGFFRWRGQGPTHLIFCFSLWCVSQDEGIGLYGPNTFPTKVILCIFFLV